MAEEYSIHLNIEQVESGEYLATSGGLPGLVAQGRTVTETMEVTQDVARKLIESCREHGDSLPANMKRIGGQEFRSRSTSRLVMARLAGFSYRDVTKKLKTFGFEFDRHA